MSKTWFVTGAARGIGAEIVKAALGAGDKVAATGRDPGKMEQAFGAGREQLLPLELDVTRAEQATTAAEAALRHFGRIDVLVNNAGYGHLGVFEESTDDEVRKQFATNVFGMMMVTRAVLPGMRQQRSGRIINISSVAGLRGGFGAALYCSSKFAVEGFSQSLAAEVAPFGVHVTVVSPGYFRTDFLDASSIVEARTHIADYDGTAGETRKLAKARNHQQQGDPKRLAQAMLELVRSGSPPMRLPMGTDAVSGIEAKNAFVGRELETWRKLSVSTDFPALA